MKRIAKFEKVSFEQFKKDWQNTIYQSNELSEEEIVSIRNIYDNIKLPTRATKGSAGYDFFAPIKIILSPNKTIKFPSGIRCKMEEEFVLKCYPRSGLGFKFRLQLDNTLGVIDSDYFYSDNEGHIFCKMTNDTKEEKSVVIEQGDGYMQGIFVEYGITIDDNVSDIRNGGFGSTTKG